MARLDIRDVERDGAEGYYLTVDGRDVRVTQYEGDAPLTCSRCGRPEQYSEGDCVVNLYTDEWGTLVLCSECLKRGTEREGWDDE